MSVIKDKEAIAMSLTSSGPEFRHFAPYFAAHYRAVPLYKHESQRDGQSLGKLPRDRGWQAKPYSIEDCRDWMISGGNLGVQLADEDLVIDEDPRNFSDGDSPLDRLREDFAIPECPTVYTGSGGRHLYLKKPVGVSIRTKLEAYPGIEFKTLGTYVVGAGSIHPSGNPYEWDPLDSLNGKPPRAPVPLIGALERPCIPGESPVPGEVSPELLAEMLEEFDPTEFQHYNQWIRFMMACHHATNGFGREEFVAWSAGDPKYYGHEDSNREKWDSLDANRPGGRTVASLFWMLQQAGHGGLVEKAMRAIATEDFAGESLDWEWFRPEPGHLMSQRDASLYMNLRYFSVLDSRGLSIGREEVDPILGCLDVVWLPEAGLKSHYKGLMVDLAPGRPEDLGSWWLKHPYRRRFDGIVFDPEPGAGNPRGRYNLWRGWRWSRDPATGR